MKKRISLILILVLAAAVLAGCAGTPVVYYTNCTCTEGTHASDAPAAVPAATPAPVEGALKTGLAFVSSISGSKDATAASYDVTIAAVLVDDSGVIRACTFDSIGADVKFDASGAITSDVNAEILTKTEKGYGYNMKAYAGSKYEWFEQAKALADYAVGKTAAELRNGAVSENGKAPAGSDLAATATITLAGYVDAIEKAVNNAKHLGAQGGDELRLAVTATAKSSASATAEKNGTAQLDADAAALTVKDNKITSCVIDSAQIKVAFDASGAIKTNLTEAIKTKNELGSAYNMVAYGKAIAEWDVQTASFCSYVTGKTLDEVKGIAVNEGTKPTDADLSSSVTIAIGGFQGLIEKAFR